MPGVVTPLALLAADERTATRNRDLAMVLALVAGVLNSVGFVAVGFYTSHMTGITAGVADHLVIGGLRIAAMGLLALGSFIAGAMVCAIQFNWARRRARADRFALVLITEAVLVLGIGLVADQLTGPVRDEVLVAALCLVMGLQNALITKVSAAAIRTTHVTGMVTDIGIELGKLLYRNRLLGADPVRADLGKLGMLAALVLLFFIGGLLGAIGYLWIGFRTLLAPAVVLIALALPPLLGWRRTRLSSSA